MGLDEVAPSKPTLERGGRRWRVGTQETAAWTDKGRTVGLTIGSAMAPVFEAYATVAEVEGGISTGIAADLGALIAPFGRLCTDQVEDGAWLSEAWTAARAESEGWQRQEHLVGTLQGFGSAVWWLGYLDTGAAYLPFAEAPRISLGPGWPYVLVEAGAAQALSWRLELPELIFPEDRRWCVHKLWDDTWTCVGGPERLIEALCDDDVLRARRVRPDEDATPPGHVAR